MPCAHIVYRRYVTVVKKEPNSEQSEMKHMPIGLYMILNYGPK